MSADGTCPSCHKPLPYDALEGRCPECLLGLLDDIPEADAAIAETTGQGFGAPVLFGEYELVDLIAKGGMGIVYKARQRAVGRLVALKMILGGRFAAKELIQRFRGEAGGRLPPFTIQILSPFTMLASMQDSTISRWIMFRAKTWRNWFGTFRSHQTTPPAT